MAPGRTSAIYSLNPKIVLEMIVKHQKKWQRNQGRGTGMNVAKTVGCRQIAGTSGGRRIEKVLGILKDLRKERLTKEKAKMA
jgi:hypothetical protein